MRDYAYILQTIFISYEFGQSIKRKKDPPDQELLEDFLGFLGATIILGVTAI